MAAKANQNAFFLPPGRVVMGSLYDLQTKDQQGREREKPNIFFGVAVPKTDPEVAAVLNIINQTAWGHYQNITHIADQLKQGLDAPNFAWKVEDGDSKKNAGREGFAGCWVFRFSTSIYPIKTGDSQNNPIDPSTIKCGYYVDIAGNCAPNELTDKNAGVYLNPVVVRLLGYGKEIQQGPSVAQAFATRAAVLPAGASALPVATGTPGGAPGPMGQPATPAAPGGFPGIGGAPAPAAPGFAAGPIAPPAPVQTQEQISAALAAQLGVQHYPGHRIRPDRSAYDPDPTPGVQSAAASPTPPAMGTYQPPLGTSPPAAGQPATGMPGAGGATTAYPSNPMLGGVAAPGVPAGASPGPAALGTPAPGFPAIASPSNPPAGVQPHPGFLTPPAPVQRTVQMIQAESAAMSAAIGWAHAPGFRPNAARNAWEADPVM
jgi:hypothetical protein